MAKNLVSDVRKTVERIKRINAVSKAKTLARQAQTNTQKPDASDVNVPKDKHGFSRKGLSLTQLFNSAPKQVKIAAIRDRVTVVSLRVSKDKRKIQTQTISFKTGTAQKNASKYVQTIENRDSNSESFNKSKRIIVYCGCPFFKYFSDFALWHRWGASDLKASIKEPPTERNPSEEPLGGCKHLHTVFQRIKRMNI